MNVNFVFNEIRLVIFSKVPLKINNHFHRDMLDEVFAFFIFVVL